MHCIPTLAKEGPEVRVLHNFQRNVVGDDPTATSFKNLRVVGSLGGYLQCCGCGEGDCGLLLGFLCTSLDHFLLLRPQLIVVAGMLLLHVMPEWQHTCLGCPGYLQGKSRCQSRVMLGTNSCVYLLRAILAAYFLGKLIFSCISLTPKRRL